MPPQRSFGTPHITGTDIESLRRSVQFWLQQTYNHLDAQAGLRGTPTFHSSLDVRGNAIRAVAPATAQDEVVIKSQLDAQHSGITDALRQEIRTAIADAFNALSPGQVVAGMIFMWSGSVATIPPGFALCDGTQYPGLTWEVCSWCRWRVCPWGDEAAPIRSTWRTTTPIRSVPERRQQQRPWGQQVHRQPRLDQPRTPIQLPGQRAPRCPQQPNNRPAFFALCFIMKL